MDGVELSEPGLSNYDLAPPITAYPLAAPGLNSKTIGVRTGAGDYVWKTCAVERTAAGVDYEHRLLAWLQAQRLSFAVPDPVVTIKGASFLQSDVGYQALFRVLSGHRPDTTDPRQSEAVGAALGELHVTLARCAITPHPDAGPYGALERVHPALPEPARLTPQDLGLPSTQSNAELTRWWAGEVDAIQPFLNDAYPALPCQVVHGDFGPSNTLVKDLRVAAIIDFEFAAPDARAIDVAAGLKFSMRIWENPNPWEIAAGFCRGYRRWVQLTPAEIEAMMHLLILRDIVSTIWCLGRGLAAGDRPVPIHRIQELRAHKRWLLAHRNRLEQVFWMLGAS